MRSRTSLLPEISLDRASGVPIYEQIARYLRQEIQSGILPPGCRLPSTRSLAGRLGLSRNTVLNAYEFLASEGLLHGTPGSCTRVAGRSRRIIRRPLEPHAILRAAHFPSAQASLRDAEGNPLYLHR